jgi:hypothetical protein
MTNLSLKQNHSLTSTSNQCIAYYEVRDEDGNRYCHCGAERDAINLCDIHPGYTYVIMYLNVPQVVDVPYVKVAPDLELPMQQILPKSNLQKFNP